MIVYGLIAKLSSGTPVGHPRGTKICCFWAVLQRKFIILKKCGSKVRSSLTLIRAVRALVYESLERYSESIEDLEKGILLNSEFYNDAAEKIKELKAKISS